MASKTAKPKTKMAIATDLFKKYDDKKPRAEIIKIFVEKAGLTKAGANTYYEKIKKRLQ